MATKYYALLTNAGAAKLANATALGEQVEITQMAVGDGNGALPTPNPAQTALVHELRRAPLNTLTIDPVNTNQIIAEQVIPEDVGGWWIREIGLYDSAGDLIAIANCAETYKPLLQEGSGRVQVIRVILIVSSTQAVTLKIDPSVVLATRQYVDDQIIQVKAYVDQQLAAHIAAADPHKQYAPKASPVFSGVPTAPTPSAGTNTLQLANTAFVQAAVSPKAPLTSPAFIGTPTAPTAAQTINNTQIATTAFVKAAIAALVSSSPEALDTLNELAAALGNDPNFATTVTNALAGKMDISKNGADIASVPTFLNNLGLGAGSALPVGVPVPWPLAAAPVGWLKCNGATFTASQYPELAKVYTGLKLPDLRGEFIRGWDDGRGVDAGRGVFTSQADAFKLHTHDSPTAGSSQPGAGTYEVPGATSNNLYADYDYYRAAPTTGMGGNETRPRNVAFNYIVRAA